MHMRNEPQWHCLMNGFDGHAKTKPAATPTIRFFNRERPTLLGLAHRRQQQQHQKPAPATMASRFWAAGSDSEADDTTSAEETSNDASSSDSDSDAPKGASRFLMGSSDSDSEDDRRVVRSAKDRRYEELSATCEELRHKVGGSDGGRCLASTSTKCEQDSRRVGAASGVQERASCAHHTLTAPPHPCVMADEHQRLVVDRQPV